MPEILELQNIGVRYGSVTAVRDLSLTMEAGEVVGLIGPNGAGKSTTLLSIMGAVRIQSGTIRFEGKSIEGSPPEDIARSGISLVPEGRHIYPEFTVQENLRLGILGRRSTDRLEEHRRWVEELFPVVKDFAARPSGQLSGGQQQQLAIARALITDPKLLLLDEPSLGLAPSIVDDLFDALAEVRARGVTILLVEQRAQLAAQFADRTIVMRSGEVALELAGDAVDPEALTAAYFGS